jgi:hypothetical protein
MKTTRINPLVFCLLAISLGFTSCEKSDDLEQLIVPETSVANQALLVSVDESADALIHDVDYNCELEVVFSDDETLVLYIEGTGYWEGYGNIEIKMSRIIDLASRTIGGEGSINTESLGLMSFVVDGANALLPGETNSDGFDYTLNVSLGTGDFQHAVGQIQMSTISNPEDPFKEATSAFGMLNLE